MGKSIMIVEDELDFHELYTAMLKDTDYEIVRAYDAVEALEKLEDKKPDLIILDILLNMVTGDTLFLYLKSMPEWADIPIIVVSGYPEQAYATLKDRDRKLAFLNKTEISERLIGEIKKKIG